MIVVLLFVGCRVWPTGSWTTYGSH